MYVGPGQVGRMILSATLSTTKKMYIKLFRRILSISPFLPLAAKSGVLKNHAQADLSASRWVSKDTQWW